MCHLHLLNKLQVGFVLSLTLVVLHADADDVTIRGDTQILTDTQATFHVTLNRRYPSIFFFGYDFNINSEPPLRQEVVSGTEAEFTHDFSNIKTGTYTMLVEVFIYFFQTKSWKVGEKSIVIQVKDNLNDFFNIYGKQNGLPKYTPPYNYIPSKLVDISADLVSPTTVLTQNSTQLSYNWTVTDPNSTHITFDGSKFEHNFTMIGQYNLKLEVTANISNPTLLARTVKAPLIKKGTIEKNFYVKKGISSVNVTGNNFVKNGSLLHLNVSCDGSGNFMICYFFSDSKSNKSCFESAIVLNNCFFRINHYFPNNGTQYVNIGVRNDVSEMSSGAKITIYKVGPSPSLVFVILPLVSSFLVIVIILGGIAHHIRQRRRLNATIEVATMESFGLYGQNSMTEKTFFERISDSFKGLFRSSPG